MSDVVILTTKLKEERDYWLTKLSREIGASSLPLDFNRSKIYAEKRTAFDISLPAEVSQGLTKMTGNSPFLLYTMLMAALKACLHKYTGSSTIVVGSPAYRREEETNGQAGPLVMVDDIDERQTFREFLMTVRETLSEAYARQSYPLNNLVKELEVEPVENKCPLFDIALVLKEIHCELPPVKNDITMIFERTSGAAVAGSIFYNARLYRRESIARFAGHFVNVLRSAVENVNAPIAALEMLSPAERRKILHDWNDTTAVYPADLCLHQLFEAQAAKTPNGIAIAFGDTKFTYGELNRRANQLARHLRGLGVGADARVGLLLERSTEMMVGLLGILKAGGAYVPLDPAYPEQRLAFMLEDAQIEVLLTQQRLVDKFPVRTGVCLDADWETIAQQSFENLSEQVENGRGVASPDNLAYVLYTSGSTGQPKGVMMNHRPLVNLIAWQVAHSANVPETRTLQFASLGFDVSFQEIFSTWCSGGTLVLVEDQVRRDAMALWQYLADEKIERLFAPFIVLQQLAEVAGVQEDTVPAQLREIVTAGEQLQVTAAVVGMFRKLNGCALHNHYGPTEAHVVSAFKLEDTPSRWPLLPAIGRPIANAEIYVLDKHGQPTPAGVAGELHIGGVSLARGYLRRPGLTAEKFVPNPFSAGPGARLYKTGDLASFRPDGNVEILGRIDHQVKIRGFRVELGEIEAALCAQAAIREAVTLVREDAPG
jgi:amino acid adenylation domain-containing protein